MVFMMKETIIYIYSRYSFSIRPLGERLGNFSIGFQQLLTVMLFRKTFLSGEHGSFIDLALSLCCFLCFVNYLLLKILSKQNNKKLNGQKSCGESGIIVVMCPKKIF